MPAVIPVFIGGMALLFGLAIVPWWADMTIALAPPLAADVAPLWAIAIGFIVLGAATIRLRGRRLTALMLPLLLLTGIEAASRIWLLAFCSQESVNESLAYAYGTYPERSAYVGHPFLQFTGRPRGSLSGIGALGTAQFNNRGFVGPDLVLEKPAGVVRLAFIGGSTTATGYHRFVERRLNELGKDSGTRFECLSFAIGFYTSTHSTVNFVLNVLDYEPDYVVFLHGWNDTRANSDPDSFLGDYSHAFKRFEPPTPDDAWLIRGSVVYRYIKRRLSPTPPWAGLASALTRPQRGNAPTKLGRTYLRNVNTIVELANAKSIVPVLVTQASSQNPEIAFAGQAPAIRSLAALLRQAAVEYGDRVVLVDLDKLTTGVHEEFFRDVGHHTREGVKFKGNTVGDAVWAHWSNR